MKDLKEKFLKLFGIKHEKEFFSPGRVNLIGEHTDYNGGNVFPCAIDKGTYALVRRRDDNKFRMYSENFAELGIIEFTLDKLVNEKEHRWVNYPKGVVKMFVDAGQKIESGFDILFYGNIPNGAGLSSSASIEILTAVVLKELFNLDIDMIEMVKIGQKTENLFIGVNSGIMDQFAVGMGKKDHAILLDCNTLKYEYVPVILENEVIVISNTNKRRGLADSKYNERRSECEKALEELQTKLNIKALGELSIEEFEANKELISNEVNRKRAKHAVYENQRTLKAQKELSKGNLEEIGKFDPFEGVTVNFSGIEPDGEAWMDYSGELLSREDFELDVPDGGLKNGDTVTVILRNSDIDSYARSLGKIPSSTQKEYTVKGLGKYISKLSDVNESLLNDAKNNAEEIIRNEISGWSRDVKLDSIDYLGYYVQSMDDFDDKNMLGVVYKLHSTISSDEEDAGVNQYYDVRFRNVVINGSGDYEIDWDNYYTPSDSFEIMVDYSYGKYSFTYTGYSTLDGLKNERNNQDYDVEMNVEDKDNSAYEQDEENSEQVEEEVKQEKKGSKKSDKKNDFLWKDSSKIKLTDSNVEKIVKKASRGDVSKKLVGRSYARMIINEMYARKGSKFNDPKLMKYFNTKSWYKKIKKKISKEKVKFSKLEQDNINILDDYDKNFLQAD